MKLIIPLFFQPVSLLALYGCDLERMKKSKAKDPRQPPPIARIRDILNLYFSQIELLLPQTCPLKMLLDILVGYCEQSPYKDRFVSEDARTKYNEAHNKLPALYAAVSLIYKTLSQSIFHVDSCRQTCSFKIS